MIYTAVTGSQNQLTTINSQLTNIGAAGLTIGGGTAIGGNTAPLRFDVAQLGTNWAANVDGDRVVNIQSGTVRLNVANGLPTNTALTVAGGASFDLGNNSTGSFNQQLAGLRGTGVVTNTNTGTSAVAQTLTLAGGGNYTFDGLFVSNGGTSQLTDLNKTGTGTQTFTNNLVSMVRNVTVSGGTLNFNGNTTLNTAGVVTVNNAAATLNVNGDLYTGSNTVLSAGAFNFAGNSLLVSNNASVNVTGAAVQLSGPNTETVYVSGNLNVTAGSLSMNANAAHYVMGTTTFAQSAANANVVVQGSYNVFQGAAAFSNNGSVTFNGTNTFNSAVTFLQQTGNVTGVNFGANSTTVFNGPTALDLTGGTAGANAQVAFNTAVTFRGGTANVSPTGVLLPGSAGLVTVGDNFGSVPATLQTTAPNLTIARPLATGNGSGVYTIGSSAPSGTTTYTGPVTLNSPAQVSTTLGGTVAFSGVIGSGAPNTGLTLVGSGTVVLSGANT